MTAEKINLPAKGWKGWKMKEETGCYWNKCNKSDTIVSVKKGPLEKPKLLQFTELNSAFSLERDGRRVCVITSPCPRPLAPARSSNLTATECKTRNKRHTELDHETSPFIPGNQILEHLGKVWQISTVPRLPFILDSQNHPFRDVLSSSFWRVRFFFSEASEIYAN